VFKNVSAQYEMSLSRKVSVALGFRYMPSTGIPFKKLWADAIDGGENVSDVITKARLSNIAVTPEVRFYLGKGYGQGFYIAPYYRYVRFTSDYIPVNYTSSVNGAKRSVTIGGDLSAHNGGILLGAQWPLGKRFNIDWWMGGAHFGASNGTLTGRPDIALSSSEQEEIRDYLEDADIPLVNKTVSVTANRVSVVFDGAFGGLRSGFCVGFRF